MNGKVLEDKMKTWYEKAGCMVTMVKRKRYFHPYMKRWLNVGEDLFHCLDGVAVCPSSRTNEQREMVGDGIYFLQSTSYNNLSAKKEKIDFNLPSLEGLKTIVDLRGWNKIRGRYDFQSWFKEREWKQVKEFKK